MTRLLDRIDGTRAAPRRGPAPGARLARRARVGRRAGRADATPLSRVRAAALDRRDAQRREARIRITTTSPRGALELQPTLARGPEGRHGERGLAVAREHLDRGDVDDDVELDPAVASARPGAVRTSPVRLGHVPRRRRRQSRVTNATCAVEVVADGREAAVAGLDLARAPRRPSLGRHRAAGGRRRMPAPPASTRLRRPSRTSSMGCGSPSSARSSARRASSAASRARRRSRGGCCGRSSRIRPASPRSGTGRRTPSCSSSRCRSASPRRSASGSRGSSHVTAA